MERRLIIKSANQQWQKLLAQATWSGVHPSDYWQAGYVVVTPGRGAVLGCCAVLPPPQAGEPGELVFSLLPTARDPAGAATALASAIADSGGPLRQRNWIADQSPEQRALEQCGFQVRETSFSYEAPLANYAKRLGPLATMLDRKRPLQANHRVTAWEPAQRSAVRHIALEEALANVVNLDRLLNPELPDALDCRTTTLAFEDNELIGMLLTRRHGSVMEFPVRWVAKGHRNSWVNARLMIHCLGEIHRYYPQVELVHFRGVETDHYETHRMCERLGGRQTASTIRMERRTDAS